VIGRTSTRGRGPSRRAGLLAATFPLAGAFAAGVLAAGALAAGADAPVDRMVRPLIQARSVTAQVFLSRSDPFGGPPERSRGRLWYQPGRGLRVRFERGGGEEILANRAQGAFFLYRAAEGTIYKAPWERTPRRLRRLIEAPERILDSDLHARPERRSLGGAPRDGYRLRDASLGESADKVSLWVSADARSGLLRWIAITAEDDSVWIELRGVSLGRTARDRDLTLSAPRRAKVEPLDPRELLPGGERH
jgi:outer membrane lipoprotein-sorting protein